MTDDGPDMGASLADLGKRDWLQAVADLCDEDGTFDALGARHYAAFIEEGKTLLVTFETLQGIHALSTLAQPFGWEMLNDHGWSTLALLSDGDTWFRDPAVYAHMDRLSDDGFFDDFDTVIFYGAGPCGYAAAAYSVAAPGAVVVAIQPQATLDPRVAGWDDRFADMRRTDFRTRYGYAPDMLEAAHHGYVLFDPHQRLDAMHAALFTRPNVTRFAMPHMGNALQTDLMDLGQLDPLLRAAADGTLDTARFAALARSRRDHRPYLRNLLAATEARGRHALSAAICRNVTDRMPAPQFARKLKQLQNR